jgi:hypothetical protein
MVHLRYVEHLLNGFMVLFPDIFSRLITIPVASSITNMTKHFIFHIQPQFVLCSYLMVLLCLSVSKCYVMFFIIMSGLLDRTFLSVCTPWFHRIVTSFLMFRYPVHCILSNVDMCRLSCLMMYSVFAKITIPLLDAKTDGATNWPSVVKWIGLGEKLAVQITSNCLTGVT